MKAYSQDFREHVLQAVDSGYPRVEIVRLFGISLSTLKRYLEKFTISSRGLNNNEPTYPLKRQFYALNPKSLDSHLEC